MAKAKKASAKTAKRPRGRPPQGNFSDLSGKPISLRIPTDLRAELEKAAALNERSFSQEVLQRLWLTVEEDAGRYRDTSTYALFAMFAKFIDMAAANAVNQPEPDAWSRDPFAFKAVRLAFDGLLEFLQPPGEIVRQELDIFGPGPGGHKTGYLIFSETPEEFAEFLLQVVLVQQPSAQKEVAERGYTDEPMATPARDRFKDEMGQAWRMLLMNRGKK
ncbi:hypothetical protein I6F36_06485 [Bradyrhizobium sp. BRP19]|uniref:hypothetical protein n=1 Tax=Bradyrhizobium sp. BRP19 TaxID=2793823 RepID=UPI001CD7CFA5|nr:hypothetical protein [Bradyrhizobium sp. BRP19]MCA1546452.1 hypothetical protein [Bradyrhizobium sp. BRP19]